MNNTNNIAKGNNFLPQPIESFVATTANTINNTIKNAGNVLKNAGNTMKNTALNTGNAFKNISAPIMNSVEAVPTDSSSTYLMISVGLLIVILACIVIFGKQITQGAKELWQKIKQVFGVVEKSGEEVVSDIQKGAEDILADIENVNKFVPSRKQVFNIAENRYTFADAEPLCKALGAELATYDQVQEAWANGADWCNYGWVKGQAAVYPTQQTTWEKLQTGTDDERLQCGMPGINGGYFDNPELRFGVNCYGDKPAESSHDQKVIMKNNIPPLTPEALAQQKKELKYRAERDQIGVLPFRTGAWSE